MSFQPIPGPVVLNLGTFDRHLNGDPVRHKVTITINPTRLTHLVQRAAASASSRSRLASGGVVIALEMARQDVARVAAKRRAEA